MPYVQQSDIEITEINDTIFKVNYLNKFDVFLLKNVMFEINPTDAILDCILEHKNNIASLYDIFDDYFWSGDDSYPAWGTKPKSAFLYEYLREVADIIVTMTKSQPWYLEWKLIKNIMES